FGGATGNLHLAPGFTDSGIYSATVTASDGEVSDSRALTITVNDTSQSPLQCSITGPLLAVPVCVPREFEAAVQGGSGVIVDYAWSFGDGNTTSGADLTNVTHAYAADTGPGDYMVSLSVRDINGQACTCVLSVHVAAPAALVTGTVLRLNQQPIPGALIEVWATNGVLGPPQTVTSRPDGS